MIKTNIFSTKSSKSLLFRIVGVLFLVLAIVGYLQIVKIIQTKQKSVTPTTQSKLQSRVQLIEGFPEMPLYPQSTLVISEIEVINFNGADSNHYRSVWKTNASIPKVTNWYLKALETADWTIEIFPADPDSTGIQYILASRRKPKLTLQLSIIPEAQLKLTKIVAEFPEKYWEEELRGKNGKIQVVVDSKKQRVPDLLAKQVLKSIGRA